MLQNNITNFLQYCKNSYFAERSIESLTLRLAEFDQFLQSQSIRSIGDINYQLLAQFVTDFNSPSVYVKKARVWSLRWPLNSYRFSGEVFMFSHYFWSRNSQNLYNIVNTVALWSKNILANATSK